jgi:hypothetical protein
VFLNNDDRASRLARRDAGGISEQPAAGDWRAAVSDGRLQEAGGIVWRRLSVEFRPNTIPTSRNSYLREVDYCSGACVAIPSSLTAR